MGTVYIRAKGCFDDETRIADAFNFLIYHGEHSFKPENIRKADPTELGIAKDKNVRPDEVRRDTVFEWTVMEDDEATYAILLGLEDKHGSRSATVLDRRARWGAMCPLVDSMHSREWASTASRPFGTMKRS